MHIFRKEKTVDVNDLEILIIKKQDSVTVVDTIAVVNSKLVLDVCRSALQQRVISSSFNRKFINVISFYNNFMKLVYILEKFQFKSEEFHWLIDLLYCLFWSVAGLSSMRVVGLCFSLILIPHIQSGERFPLTYPSSVYVCCVSDTLQIEVPLSFWVSKMI